MLAKDGVPTEEDIKRISPPKERLEKGPVAIIECFQEIPCDPCYTSCPKGAIRPFPNINALPEIDFELCDGCSLCVSACPGIAIFVVDLTYSDKLALLKLPHEFAPLPKKGEKARLLNRKGEIVGEGEVVRAIKFKDKTSVVWVTAPKELAMEVRAIAPPAYEEENELRKLVEGE
ncbi:4Fe-4S ferredoxin [bacterium]|nr:MAG: 4Fe-4S ferredoxin [bacterium]